MTLTELNDRWRGNGQPHAISDEGTLFQWHCPWCQQTGVAHIPLHAAMNDALMHRKRCATVDLDSALT